MVYFEVRLCGCREWFTLRWDCVWLWGMVYCEVRLCVVVGNGLLWGETVCGCGEWFTVRWDCGWEWFTLRWDCVVVGNGLLWGGTVCGCWALFALRWNTSHKKISSHHVCLKRNMSSSNFKPGFGMGCSSIMVEHWEPTADTGSFRWCGKGIFCLSPFLGQFSCCFHAAPCAFTCTDICVHVKNLKHWQPQHCLDTWK